MLDYVGTKENISFLIDVYMELLLQEEVNNPLVLAGRKGWKMEHFLESIGEKYRGNVLVTGFLENEDLP